jgi:hypothetical protein
MVSPAKHQGVDDLVAMDVAAKAVSVVFAVFS